MFGTNIMWGKVIIHRLCSIFPIPQFRLFFVHNYRSLIDINLIFVSYCPSSSLELISTTEINLLYFTKNSITYTNIFKNVSISNYVLQIFFVSEKMVLGTIINLAVPKCRPEKLVMDKDNSRTNYPGRWYN